ncbi:MAG TPA: hypothetical protein VHY84_18905 [Bryobacteraceae bacterium]|jgi:anti-sigma28 factor (negative regulator of flagellin synthesis)|nr:hypothetical protein [Bryobacteraceae bacterium]
MSIRVNNTDVALTTQTGAAGQVKPSGPGGSGGAASGKTGEDQLEVSSATENIQSALASQGLQHSERLRQLGNLVAEGRYSVDSLDLSRSIVSSGIVDPADK